MKIKAKATIAGSYGLLETGQTANVEGQLAQDLKKAGLVDIIDEKTPADAPKEGTDMTALRNTKTKPKK
ncbi:hypothetical protein [Rufibacter soli]